MVDASQIRAALEAAIVDLRAGQPDAARRRLEVLTASAGHIPDFSYFLGLAQERTGDCAAAEISFRKAASLEKGRSRGQLALADMLNRLGRFEEAEHEFRNALRRDSAWSAAAAGLGDALVAQGRTSEAILAMRPLATGAHAGEALLATYASALKATGATEEALAINQNAVSTFPASAVAEHNLAGTLGDLARHEEAEAAVRRAFAKGIDAPESWLVLARALQGLQRFDEAQAAFIEALRRRPGSVDAHTELAQLIWMRTGDPAEAMLILGDTYARAPSADLARVKAKALAFTGDLKGADECLREAAARAPGDVMLLGAAAQAAAAAGDAGAGLAFARRAAALSPNNAQASLILSQTLLGAGELDAAETALAALHAQYPLDQTVLALQATCWRLLGDSRYATLYDYDRMVKAAEIEVPPGWTSLAAYLADLASALRDMHRFHAHPFDQSVRGGSQATDLLVSRVPTVAALPKLLEPRIADYIAWLGQGDDLLRSRITARHRFAGMWSVLLRPDGFHVDHVHQKGWISSAFYVETVSDAADPGHEGWFKLGEPGIRTTATLPAERFLRPEPGMLVLFPSYMWHGTVSFAHGRRLSVAFDVVPA